jgi:hypothetical protein
MRPKHVTKESELIENNVSYLRTEEKLNNHYRMQQDAQIQYNFDCAEKTRGSSPHVKTQAPSIAKLVYSTLLLVTTGFTSN